MTEHDEPDLQPEEVRLLARQIDGWACIRCGSAPGIDKPMKPAGIVDGRQVFWCATDCTGARQAAIIKAEHDRVEKLISERIEKVNYRDTWAEQQAYKQGLADAVGIMRYVPREDAPAGWHL